MDVRHLTYFLAVVDAGGFRAASRELHLSQPPLTRAVHELEERLGCKLLKRGGATVVPTPAGAVLVTRARKILDAIARAEADVRDAAREHGAARVGHVLPEYFADPALARALARLRRRSHAEPEITPMLPHTAASALARNSIDVAFVFLPFESGKVEARIEPILHDRLVAAMAVDHPLARARRVSLAKLADHELVLFPRRAMPERHDDILGHFTRAGLRPRIATVGPSLRQALERCASSRGVSMVPERASRTHDDLALTLRPIADVATLWTLAAVIREKARQSAGPLVRALQRAAD